MFDHARQSHLARTAHRFKRKQPAHSSSLVRWQHNESVKTTRKKHATNPRTKRPTFPSLKNTHQRNVNAESLSLLTHPTSQATKRILVAIAMCCFSVVALEIFFVNPSTIADIVLPQLYLPLLLPLFVGLFCLTRLKTTAALAILPAAGITLLVSLQLQHFIITWQVVLAICCILGVGAIVAIVLRMLVLVFL